MIFLLYTISGEPARTFMAKNFLMDSAFCIEALKQGGWLNRAAGQSIEMWVGNFVAKAVVLVGFGNLPFFIGIGTKTSGVVVSWRCLLHRAPSSAPIHG